MDARQDIAGTSVSALSSHVDSSKTINDMAGQYSEEKRISGEKGWRVSDPQPYQLLLHGGEEQKRDNKERKKDLVT